MESCITENEIFEAIRAAMSSASRPEGAVTVAELAASTGRHAMHIRKAVGALVASGAAEPVRVPQTYMDGRRGFVPGYRLKAMR